MNSGQVVVASDVCAKTLPSSPLACVYEYGATKFGGTLQVTKGKPVYFYVADTTSGSGVLDNPLKMTIAEVNCATFKGTATPASPSPGSTTSSLAPKLVLDFDVPMATTVGIITVKGDKGTNQTYNLGLAPPELVFTNNAKTLTISPKTPFKAGEKITVSWSGVLDAICNNATNALNWQFSVVTPPCSPGSGGLLGSKVTKMASGITSSFSEYYLAVDESPTGNVYLGSYYSYFYRFPKTGGTATNIYSSVPLSSTYLGYNMLVSGSSIFTLDSSYTKPLYRISTNGGSSWKVENYATLSTSANDDFRGLAAYKGKIYMATDEYSATTGTQIFSLNAAGAAPQSASLTTHFTGEGYCNGLAVDDSFYYLTCGTGDRLVRVNRKTKQVTLITDAFDLNTARNFVEAHDTSNNGIANYLYFKGSRGEIHFVCNPASSKPYVDTLTTYSTATSTYGMALDRTNKRLWAYDDITKEFVVVQ